MSTVSQGIESTSGSARQSAAQCSLAQSPAKRDESPYPLRWRAWYAVRLLTQIRLKAPVLWQEIVDFAVKEKV
jgi:hypothetical protein